MEPRTKSVMQTIPDSLANARSNIPVPSTVKKIGSNSRLSVAGTAMRYSISVAPATNPRQSVMRSQNVNPLLQSSSKSNVGKTPLTNSIRRGSTRMPLPPSANNQLIKDSRNLRDRAYQSKMRQEIHGYLNESGFEIAMSALQSMQSSNYRIIFETLVFTIDPGLHIKEGTRFEDVFIPTLKSLQYPYVHQLDPKWLVTVASPHSWPFLLGVLHWLVEFCKMRRSYFLSEHPSIQETAHVPEEFDDPMDHKALALKFCEDAYALWLDEDEEILSAKEAVEDRYKKKNEKVQKELKEHVEQLNRATAEYNRLLSTAPQMKELRGKNEQLKKDSAKLAAILDRYTARKERCIEQIAFEKSEFSRAEIFLSELKTELRKLDDTVESQNLSPEEVIRMTTDRETLTKSLEDLKLKISEAHSAVMTLEVKVANRSAAVEEAVDTYTNILSSLELFPTAPEPWQDIDLTLVLNSAATNPQRLLSGSDIKKVIKPTLSSVAEAKRIERATIESESVKVDNELDQLKTECINLDYELCELEKKAANLNEQADELREAAQQEAQVSSAEASRLERELAHARTAAIANGLGVKSRLQSLQFSHNEQIEKVSRLKEDTVRAILKNSQEMALFKQEVSRHLQELRDFAEME